MVRLVQAPAVRGRHDAPIGQEQSVEAGARELIKKT